MLIVSLISVEGGYKQCTRGTAVGAQTRFQATVGQVPPGKHPTTVKSGPLIPGTKLGVELAFHDAAWRCWLRRGDGRLEEVKDDPVTLYKLQRPVEWKND